MTKDRTMTKKEEDRINQLEARVGELELQNLAVLSALRALTEEKAQKTWGMAELRSSVPAA